MNKNEWERFWRRLIDKAEQLDIDFLIEYWLEDQREEWEANL